MMTADPDPSSHAPIKVVLVEQPRRHGAGLATLLRSFGDFDLRGSAWDPDDAMLMCASHACDVLVVDLTRVVNPSGLLAQLRRRIAGLRIVAVAEPTNTSDPRLLRHAGADEVLSSPAPPALLIGVIRRLGRPRSSSSRCDGLLATRG